MPSNRKALVNVIIAVTVVLIALAVAVRSRDTDPHQTLEDNGATVLLEAGGTLIIDLKANPSTGYTWEVESIDESMLRSVGEPAYESDADLEGSPGTMTFTFEATGSGETELRLVYHRPWEDEDPIQTYTLFVDAG